jgi:hypothetical protein
MGTEGVDLINLAQDKEKWWAVTNMVVNFSVAHTVKHFLKSY